MKIYTVKELTQTIKEILELDFYDIWVTGEVSNMSTPKSGHTYFTLKDASSQIKAVLFKSDRKDIRFGFSDGSQIIARGRLTVYETRGEYQLIISYVEPKGLGALQQAFIQLKERLKKEGLFDERHKKSLPLIPKKIGIVTSPTGAAIRDMLNIIKRRFANVHIVIYPVKVQGEGAANEIVDGIKYLNNQSEGMDVIIVGRGGGSIEDLWAFNEEIVARAIFDSKIPIISAVGHETDFTIADFVADLRAPTPSAAAELVIKNEKDIREKIDLIKKRLIGFMQSKVAYLCDRLKLFLNRRVFLQPATAINMARQRLDDLCVQLNKAMHLLTSNRQGRLKEVINVLTLANPLSIMERGYSICRRAADGNIIKYADTVLEDERINIQLFKGQLTCKVEKVKV